MYVADSTGSIIGLIKGDTRSLDYGSFEQWQESVGAF